MDLTNMKIGKLNIISLHKKYIHTTKSGNKCSCSEYNCVCDCGKEIIRSYSYLSRHKYDSNFIAQCNDCGKKSQKENISGEKCHSYKHGMEKTRLYNIWSKMIERCKNKNHVHYHNYGGRGIQVCDEWHVKDFGFINFRDWAFSSGYSENLTLDRKDNNGNYSPDNCKWSTTWEQGQNMRNNIRIEWNGKNQTISEWAIELGINREKIRARYSSTKKNNVEHSNGWILFQEDK